MWLASYYHFVAMALNFVTIERRRDRYCAGALSIESPLLIELSTKLESIHKLIHTIRLEISRYTGYEFDLNWKSCLHGQGKQRFDLEKPRINVF